MKRATVFPASLETPFSRHNGTAPSVTERTFEVTDNHDFSAKEAFRSTSDICLAQESSPNHRRLRSSMYAISAELYAHHMAYARQRANSSCAA